MKILFACIWVGSLSIAYFIGHFRAIEKSELSTDNNFQNTIVPSEQATVASVTDIVNDVQKELSRFEVGYSFESIAASYQIVQKLIALKPSILRGLNFMVKETT